MEHESSTKFLFDVDTYDSAIISALNEDKRLMDELHNTLHMKQSAYILHQIPDNEITTLIDEILSELSTNEAERDPNIGESLDMLQIAKLLPNNSTQSIPTETQQLLLDCHANKDIDKILLEVLKSKYIEKNINASNHYADDNESKQINVFDLVLKYVSPVCELTQIAFKNIFDFYMNAINDGIDVITHVNIGIGRGNFEVHLLNKIIQNINNRQLKQINFVGIDIDPTSLDFCEKRLHEIMQQNKRSINFTINVHKICTFVEKMDEIEWKRLKSMQITGIISAFTLHHLKSTADRIKVLKQISHVYPQKFVLIEPDVDNYTAQFNERLLNCRDNFGAVFDLLDETEASESEKNMIKFNFFYNEINDVMGKSEEDRFEKHELSHIWAQRLKKIGFKFKSQCLYNYAQKSLMEYRINEEYNYVMTSYNDINLVAMFDCECYATIKH